MENIDILSKIMLEKPTWCETKRKNGSYHQNKNSINKQLKESTYWIEV